MDSNWLKNLKSESFWLRSLFMVLFIIVYRIVDIVVLLIALSQWFYVLLTGDTNNSLTRFAGSLSQYIAQIVSFLGYHTHEKPFPFSDWPSDQNGNKSLVENEPFVADDQDA